jgi:hypothetical protein
LAFVAVSVSRRNKKIDSDLNNLYKTQHEKTI